MSADAFFVNPNFSLSNLHESLISFRSETHETLKHLAMIRVFYKSAENVFLSASQIRLLLEIESSKENKIRKRTIDIDNYECIYDLHSAINNIQRNGLIQDPCGISNFNFSKRV